MNNIPPANKNGDDRFDTKNVVKGVILKTLSYFKDYILSQSQFVNDDYKT
jgi:hypothetical protein